VFGRQVFGGQFEVRLIEFERPYDVIEPFGKLGGGRGSGCVSLSCYKAAASFPLNSLSITGFPVRGS
jgi:hypothetical protein